MEREIRVKRIYDESSPEDGCRVLVDRLWPRGISEEVAQIDLWAKALTPSNELRKWFHKHLECRDEFAIQFTAELNERKREIQAVLQLIDQHVLTLISSTKDLEKGHVGILRQFLERDDYCGLVKK